jgi:CubicO group peptidase (beta-lactamase class C family)
MFQAYHGVSAGQHQANFDHLSGQGYRMISLSVYGDPGNAHYAAVWVQRSGPAWMAVHGVNAAGYQTFFNNQTARGFVPVLVSATGSASDSVFAAVFEQGIGGSWFARHGMTSGPEANSGTFQNNNKTARNGKMILRSMAMYGSASDRRYIAVWHANPGFTKWHVHYGDDGAGYQTVFNAETSNPFYRPTEVAVSGNHLYCSLFKDDMVGPWVARHGMTSAQYQTEFDQQTARGFYPISVQGGGSGSDTRYTAIFAQRDIPLPRHWHATGPAVASLAGFDHAMQSFMQANAVRGAQLTIAKNGVTKLARAYTWAEDGYRITQPSDRFLLASCSKMFLEAAVQSLYDAKPAKLQPATKVYPLLGFSHPADPRSDAITIQQLLDHMGGYDDTATGSNFDPTYQMRKIALDQGLGHKVSKLDVCRYMYARMLDFTPGARSAYSNFGYLLASAVVEKVTGMDYFAYVKNALLEPAGINEVEVRPTAANQQPPTEALIADEGLGHSALDPLSPLLVPAIFGGDGEVKEVGAACAGTSASATALTRFIHTHAVWGNGGRAPNSARSGSTPGSSTLAFSRGDGVDWAYVINTRNWPPNTAPTLDDLGHTINHLLDTILLP